MQPTDLTLQGLAEAVADGTEVDWDQAESTARTQEEREVISQLRRLADVGAATRRQATTWGSLEIRGEIGSGTFGTVYRAWDRTLEREVALKLLHDAGTEALHTSRLVKEGRLLARIRHPNVVVVHGADAFEGRVGIWMEFVTGQTLKKILQEQGPFGPQEALLIGRDLCRALASVHKQGYLHRDVKAQNVMREAGGRIVLMDFGAGEGVGTIAAAGAPLAGTPAYLAPEVIAGSPQSIRSDLYSLGVLLYHLVTGEFPVVGQSLDDLRLRHARGERVLLRDVRPDLPEAFVRAIDKATAENPADRPESAGALEQLLSQAMEIQPLAAVATADTRENLPSNTNARTGRWTRRYLAVIVLVALAGGLAAAARQRWHAPVVARNSVAVLPFKNLTADPDADYFSDGITQDVGAHLMALRDLRVISGASMLRYRDRSTSVTEIGTALGVAAVLEGSVQRSGDRVRITSQILDAGTGEQLWSETFDRDLKDIFAMQSEVSRRIAMALKGELSQLDAQRLAVDRGHDFEAFNLYMKGRHAWALRTEDGLNRSVQYFQGAIDRDPQYALAYAGLADAYTSFGAYGLLSRTDAYARAAAAAEKAVALDSTLPEAHASLAYVQKNRFAWAESEASFKRALALKPGLALTHHWYSVYLTQQGRFPEAITEIKTAISLDPLSIGANLQLASVLMMARRYADAISQWERTLQMDAGFVNAYRGMTSAYTYLGLFDRAQAAAAEAARQSPLASEDQELKADLGYLLAVSDHRSDALAIVRELTDRYRQTGEDVAGSIAAIHAGLGQTEPAFEWLSRAEERHDPELGYLKVDPRWQSLRGDSRFTALLARLGFIP